MVDSWWMVVAFFTVLLNDSYNRVGNVIRHGFSFV